MKISQLKEGFLNFKRERGVCKKTASNYNINLEFFMRHCGNLEVEEINPFHLSKIKDDKRYSVSQRNGTIHTINSFLTYCQELGYNCKKIFIRPLREEKEIQYLEKRDIKKFLKSIKNPKYRTIFEVMAGTGARVFEIASLRKDKLDLENQIIMVSGKGNKERALYLTSRCVKFLKKHLKTQNDNCPAIFTGDGKNFTTSGTIQYWLRRHRKRVGFTKPLTCHIIRHSVATLLAQKGRKLEEVKIVMGHSNIQTTAEYYVAVEKKRLRKKLNRNLAF